jgi:ATP-dependent DNA helicase RecG
MTAPAITKSGLNYTKQCLAEVQIIGKIINIKTVEFTKGRKRLIATL